MRLLLPLYGLVLVAFAAGCLYLFKVGLDDHNAANSLSAQVSVPEGLSARPYRTEDGELITQSQFVSTDASTTTHKILAGYEIPTGKARDGFLTTFARENEEMIALRIRNAPHRPVRKSLAERVGGAAPPNRAPSNDTVFATVAGLPVVQAPQYSQGPEDEASLPVIYRYFTLVIGDQTVDEVLELSLLTNSSDAALAAVLGGLDMVGLNARLPTPDPRVDAAAGVQPSAAFPLSDLPPRPSVAYRAAQQLETGKVLDVPWQDALLQIRAGEITSWDDLHAGYPDIATLPPALFEVMDNGSQEFAARYQAAILSKVDREWSNHEYYVLSKIAERGSTQADFAAYLAGEHEVAIEVLSLVRQLPESP